jgi:hypothetical protein
MGRRTHLQVGGIYFQLIFPRFWIDDADLDGILDHPDQIMDAKLSGNVGPMLFHGFGAHAEDIRDCVCGVSFHDQSKHLLFPFRQKVISTDHRFFLAALEVCPDDVRLDLGTQKILSPVHGPDGLQHIGAGGCLEHVTEGSGGKGQMDI